MKTEAKEATCTENGNVAYWTCSVCNHLYLDENAEQETTANAVVKPAGNHKLTLTDKVDPKCETAGNIAYWTCSVCNKIFSDAQGKMSFTGLKPGSTTVTIYGRSPIMENEDTIYTVTVDEDLHVTLTPVRAISSFYVYRNGEINYDSYRITLDTDGYYVSVNEEPAEPFNKFLAQAFVEIIDKYDVASWDGFAESQDFVLDGEGFWLEFTLTDGTRVLARGDNAFPEHYFDAMGEIWEILTR